jgi:hypothetical protein
MTLDQSRAHATATNSRQIGSKLLSPATCLLVGANLLPIVGVLRWDWDVFVLLMLYWMETAVIGFWMIVRIAIAPPGSLGLVEVGGRPAKHPSLLVAAFFVVHAGIFMSVHMMFLWSLFAGDWATRVDGPASFVGKIIIGTRLWLPLLALFVVRGIAFAIEVWRPTAIDRLLSQPPARRSDKLGTIVGGFYTRIIVMHLTIIVSGVLAAAVGSVIPLLVMIGLKTTLDLGYQIEFGFGKARKPATEIDPQRVQ